MKRLFTALLVLLLLSCKNETTDGKYGSIYPEEAVAVKQGGVFTLTNEEELAKSWKAGMGADSKLTAFEIVKSKTEGDAAVDFYMLVARPADGAAVIAALLEQKDDKLYFATGDTNSDSYLMVVCKGECDTGCLPVARNTGGVLRLICSSCADCEKKEIETR